MTRRVGGAVTRLADLLVEVDDGQPAARLRDVRTWRVLAELPPADGLVLAQRLTRQSLAASAALPLPDGQVG